MADVVRKKISNEEAAKLGLVAAPPPATRKKLSNDEAAQLGLEPPAAATEQKPSTGRAIAEGAVQGGTYGFGDELQGVLGAALRRSPGLGYPTPEEMGEENIFSPTGYGDSFVNDYRKERDAARRDTEAAKAAHPTAFNTSQIATAILAPGPKAGKTVKGFMKAGAKGGAAFGLGTSDSDLTKGDVGGAAVDTAIGGGVGGAAGVVGGVLAKPLQALSRKATEAGQAAYSRGVEQANKPIDKAINSARGALGGEVAAGSRGIEMAEKAAVNPRLSEDVSRAAGDALSDAEVQALEERVARAQIGGLHGRLPRIEKAQTAFDDALEGGTPEARKAAVEVFMSKSPLKRATWEVTKRLLPTLLGAGVGGQLGGTAGAGVGGSLGLLTSAMSGRPGRIITNALRSPQVQRSAAQFGDRAAGELAPGAVQGLHTEQAGNEQSTLREKQSTLREKLAPYLQLLEEEKK